MASTTLVGSSFFGLDLSRLTARWSSLRRKVARGQLLLEFDLGTLRYGLGAVRDGVLDLSSIGRIDLPDEALERGVPTDPAQMAGLIREICQEHQLYAHQVSVVLPSEAALLRVVELPADLSIDQARETLLDPELGPQLPIPLSQADFDLVRCHLPLRRTSDQQLLRRYLLVAIPRELTGKILTTMELAELHLQRLEVAPMAGLRLKKQELTSLGRAEFDLWLELLPGRSICTVVSDSGPVAQKTLVSIRDFPEPELTSEQASLCVSEGLKIEDIAVGDSRYLPMSDLDLRVLAVQIREFQANFAAGLPECRWVRVWISGLNCAHPLLEELLQDQLELPVQRIYPLAEPQLGKVSYARLLLCSGLSRLMGLAMGLSLSEKQLQPSQDDSTWVLESDQSSLVEIDLSVLLNQEASSGDQEIEDQSSVPVALELEAEARVEPPPSKDLYPSPDDDVQDIVVELESDIHQPAIDLDQNKISDIKSESESEIQSIFEQERLDFNSDDAFDSETEKSESSDLNTEQWPSIQDAQGSRPQVSQSEWPSIANVNIINEDPSDSQSEESVRTDEFKAKNKDKGQVSGTNEEFESSFGELRFSEDDDA